MSIDINSLPTETLCKIFLCLSDQDPVVPRSNGLHWISSATHVCWKWRQAAIGCSELWSDVICAFASDAATDCFFTRAQSRLLHFSARMEKVGENKYGCLVKETTVHDLSAHQVALGEENLARLRAFEHPGTLPASFEKAITRNPLTHLTILRLRCWRGTHASPLVEDVQLNVPALRELYLDGVFFALNAPLLLVLEVKNTFDEIADAPSPALLLTLENAPLLQRLAVKSPFALQVEHDDLPDLLPDDSKFIELPNLSMISFSDTGPNLGLYSRLRIPQDVDVHFEYTARHAGTDLPIIFEVMQSHLICPKYDTLIAHFTYDEHWNRFAQIRLRRHGSERYHQDLEGESEFRLDVCIFSRSAEQLHMLEIIEALVPYIDTSNIRYLDFGEIGYGDGVFYEADLHEALAPFTNVQTAILNGSWDLEVCLCREDSNESDAEGSWESLDEGDSDAAADDWTPGEESESLRQRRRLNAQRLMKKGAIDPSELTLPNLRHLIVQDVSNDEGMNLAMDVGILRGAWTAVFEVMEERIRAGRPLKALSLSGYHDLSGPSRRADLDLRDLREVDAECLRRAHESVDPFGKVNDWRKPFRSSKNPLADVRISALKLDM